LASAACAEDANKVTQSKKPTTGRIDLPPTTKRRIE
jgi:hypothetical protein